MEVPIIDISSYRPILGENFTDDCHNINNSDLNPLLSERKQAIIHQIVESFSSLGFIYIIGHGVSIELLELVSQQNQLFYSLSLEEKLSFMSKDKARRGYSSINTENFASLAGEVKPNDLVEKLRFGPEISSEILENDSYYHSNECKVHFMPNEWGNLSTTFRDVVLEYYNSMQRLAVLILEMLALGLGQSADYFTSSMDKHTSILTFNHFPSVSQLELPIEPNQLRVAEHTDVSLITIVNQLQPNSCPTSSSVGLEICTPDGQWIPIPNIPGALVINIGDCLQYWSNFRLKSTRHRVVLPSQQDSINTERYSIAYFVSPNYDTILHQIQPEDQEKKSISYSTWRKERIKEAMKALKKDGKGR